MQLNKRIYMKVRVLISEKLINELINETRMNSLNNLSVSKINEQWWN
jgi:hypothetical protein